MNEDQTIVQTDVNFLEEYTTLDNIDMVVKSITTNGKFKDNDKVTIVKDVAEKNVDLNSLYVKLVEGNEMQDEDMLDLDTLYKEYVLDEDIDN